MDILLVIFSATSLVVLLLVFWQLWAINKKLALKNSEPNDGGEKPPTPTSQTDEPNDPKLDPPLPT